MVGANHLIWHQMMQTHKAMFDDVPEGFEAIVEAHIPAGPIIVGHVTTYHD